MNLKAFAEKHGLMATEDPSAPGPLTGTEGGGVKVAASPPQTSVAAILMARRQNATAAAESTPVSTSLAASSPAATADATRRVSVSPEVLDHFHNVANSSRLPGFTEFVTQVRVLGKHIRNESDLYAAVLDSIGAAGIGKDAVIRAIENRIQLVTDEKEGALGALEGEKQNKLKADQARVGEIGDAVRQLRAEIAERERQIGELESEGTRLSNAVSTTSAEFDDDKAALAAAGDQVLQELTGQMTKLRSLGTT